MKASRFNFATLYPASGETLLFNTLTGALCALDPATAGRVKAHLEHPDDDEPDLTQFLTERGFLVDDSVNESAVVEARSRLGINDPNRLDVIVMPNMNCNLACVYCYEDHAKSNIDIATRTRLMRWLEQMVPRFKVVLLSWFGGEPLLSYQDILVVQRYARDLCARHHVGFSSHMTTNGVLLTREKASELIGLDLLSYQITLDGPPEAHNRLRPMRGGGPSFEQILQNIRGLTELDPRVRVTLRVNFNDTNIDRIPALLDAIPAPIRGQLDVVFERIFGEQYAKFVDHMPLRRVGASLESLYNMATQLGYSVSTNPTGPDKLTYCYADRRSMFLFNYTGDVFKCTVDKFRTDDRLGSLTDDGAIAWEHERLEAWHGVDTFEDKCHSCTFMPMCMGGCRKLRSREGTVGDDCQLPFAGFDLRLQQRYARERGDTWIADNVDRPGAGLMIPLRLVEGSEMS